MKKLLAVILVLFISVSAFTAIAGNVFGPDSFKIDIIKKKHMKTVSKKNLPSELKVDYAFTNDKNTYQLWYTLLKQNDTNVSNEELMMSYSLCVMTYILNMAGEDIIPDAIRRFNDADVKNDFNGDFGTTVFIENPKPEFNRGFRYMMVNFYCKRNHGIVVQTILFSSVDTIMESEFIEVFNSFKFKK